MDNNAFGLLTSLTVNFGGTLLIYSLMAFFLARLHWHDRGVLPVIVTIIAANGFWIIPFLGFRFAFSSSMTLGGYSLCFGNWLTSAFAVIILCQTARGIPRQLEDSARLDGCGWLGTFWHAVLPLVRRDLILIGVLIVMTTVPPFVSFATGEGWSNSPPPLFGIFRLPSPDCLGCIVGVSALSSLAVIGIFLAAKGKLEMAPEA